MERLLDELVIYQSDVWFRLCGAPWPLGELFSNFEMVVIKITSQF
jgi:hypothetical protein